MLPLDLLLANVAIINASLVNILHVVLQRGWYTKIFMAMFAEVGLFYRVLHFLVRHLERRFLARVFAMS